METSQSPWRCHCVSTAFLWRVYGACTALPWSVVDSMAFSQRIHGAATAIFALLQRLQGAETALPVRCEKTQQKLYKYSLIIVPSFLCSTSSWLLYLASKPGYSLPIWGDGGGLYGSGLARVFFPLPLVPFFFPTIPMCSDEVVIITWIISRGDGKQSTEDGVWMSQLLYSVHVLGTRSVKCARRRHARTTPSTPWALRERAVSASWTRRRSPTRTLWERDSTPQALRRNGTIAVRTPWHLHLVKILNNLERFSAFLCDPTAFWEISQRRGNSVESPLGVTGLLHRQTWTQREKKSPKITNLNKAAFLLRSYCDLCVHTTFSRRAHHDLSALMAFLVRSMGSATAITGDPAALSPRSWGSYHASSTCIATARRPQGVSTTFSRRL